MSFTTSYRPPPPAPSAFFAMQLAAQSAVQAPSQTSSAYLPRISSKMSLNMSSGGAHTLPIISAGIVQTAPASRNNSASSITALPSLSSSLNNLHSATSLDHVDIVGTQTPEAEELLRRVIQGNVKRMSNPSMGPVQGSNGPERTFSHYSDDSDSDEEGDEEEEGYFRHSMRRSDQPRHAHHSTHNGGGTSPQSNRSNKASAGRSGLVMNRSRKDRLASGASGTFAF